VINAMKFAYAPGARGPINVDLRRDGDDVVLIVSDEGSGLPEGLDPATAESMGFTLVRSLASQIKGLLDFGTGGPGFQARLRFRSGDAGGKDTGGA
jgi:two-component sensor histidine kinase